MSSGPWPRVPEHLIRKVQDEYRERYGRDVNGTTARLWAIKEDHDRRVAAREAGQEIPPSEIEYAPDDDPYAQYAAVDRPWRGD